MEIEAIESVMVEKRTFKPPLDFQNKAIIKSFDEYKEIYNRSVRDPEGFWAGIAENLHWFKKWNRTFCWDPEKAECKWFTGGKLNASYNCLDWHVGTWRRNKAAIIWEGESGRTETYTYNQLYREVCRFANVLKNKG